MCPRADEQRGFAVAEWLAALCLALVIVAVVTQVVVAQYGRAAVRHAVDEGARAGSAFGAGAGDCRRRAEAVLRGAGGLLPGPLGRDITIECALEWDPPQMVASGRGRLGLRLPFLPSVAVDVTGRAVVEELP